MAEIPNPNGLSMKQAIALDLLAEGKSPRAIAETLGITPGEAAKLAYDLLDSEIITDAEQRRKLNVYRLEKIVEALWVRTMNNANKDDVKNLVDVLDKLNILLGLNKEQDLEAEKRMHDYQLFGYMAALQGLILAFRQLAPDLMTEEQWMTFTAEKLEKAKETMVLEIEG